MRKISFFVPGTPRPGGSKRVFIPHRKGETPGEAISRGQRPIVADMGGEHNRNWRNAVQAAAANKMREVGELFDGPLFVTVRFCMPRPKHHYNSKGVLKLNAPHYHTGKPDATKLMRSTEDALKGVVWRDDAQICMQVITKNYEERPGAYIDIEDAIPLTPYNTGLVASFGGPSHEQLRAKIDAD
jgi:Holliday junction resolvase RusA-like endonuclease